MKMENELIKLPTPSKNLCKKYKESDIKYTAQVHQAVLGQF